MTIKERNQLDAFERIVNASAELFSIYSFHSVSVREIAKKANVNISMISYYFGGKAGILIEIINRFFDLHFGVIKASIIDTDTEEQTIKRLFKNMVDILRFNTHICLVGFSDLPNNVPEVFDLKINKTNRLIELGNQISKKFGIDFNINKDIAYILGPAMMSMLTSHFTHKNSISQQFKIAYDDEYYEKYSNTLAELFLYGIFGLKNFKK